MITVDTVNMHPHTGIFFTVLLSSCAWGTLMLSDALALVMNSISYGNIEDNSDFLFILQSVLNLNLSFNKITPYSQQHCLQ